MLSDPLCPIAAVASCDGTYIVGATCTVVFASGFQYTLISEVFGAQYFRFEGNRLGKVNRNFRYREAVPYWIMCVSVCAVS